MYRQKTTIVLGAGASAEFCMPTGTKLRGAIQTALRIEFTTFGEPRAPKGYAIGDAIQLLARQQNASTKNYEPACTEIVRAMPGTDSIDAYIDTRGDNPHIATIGKLAIVECILKAEANSDLKIVNDGRQPIDIAKVENTWAMKLARMMFDGCQKDDLKSRLENLSLIIFNYDRCFEHFLCNYIQTQYAESQAFAADVVRSLNPIHPYGTVGDLPWQADEISVPFGVDADGKAILLLSRDIHTYTEQIEDKKSLVEIHDAIRTAQRLIFLGFAFHEQNMELLTPDPRGNPKMIYATAKGKSESDLIVIANENAGRFGEVNRTKFVSGDCAKLFDEYYHELKRP